jgi:hypothetical protein
MLSAPQTELTSVELGYGAEANRGDEKLLIPIPPQDGRGCNL